MTSLEIHAHFTQRPVRREIISCTSKRWGGTASFLFNNRTKLELWHLVDSVFSVAWNAVFNGGGKEEGGRRMDMGCLVRSVKQWWTVGDGKSIKIPRKKKQIQNLPKKRRESEREIKSGVCRNRLETFVDPTVVDVHIYLSLHTHAQLGNEELNVRRIERFGVFPIRHFLIFSFRWRILCFDTMNRLIFSFLFLLRSSFRFR